MTKKLGILNIHHTDQRPTVGDFIYNVINDDYTSGSNQEWINAYFRNDQDDKPLVKVLVTVTSDDDIIDGDKILHNNQIFTATSRTATVIVLAENGRFVPAKDCKKILVESQHIPDNIFNSIRSRRRLRSGMNVAVEIDKNRCLSLNENQKANVTIIRGNAESYMRENGEHAKIDKSVSALAKYLHETPRAEVLALIDAIPNIPGPTLKEYITNLGIDYDSL
jgi:hypothetical protein